MRTIRLLALGVLVIVGLYFVFRAAAAGCVGPACDLYIPFYIPLSLLLPLLILVMVAVTGILSTARARGEPAWFAALLACTIVGIAGPVIALLIFRDNPDVFVPVAATLGLLLALAVLAYSFRSRR